MYCKMCGKDIGDAIFCPYCGTKTKSEKEGRAEQETIEEKKDTKMGNRARGLCSYCNSLRYYSQSVCISAGRMAGYDGT